MQQKEAIKIWQKLGINNAVFNFNAGGDSMGETEIFFYQDVNCEQELDKDKHPDLNDLETYIDDVIYTYVDFYVDNEGEYGKVHITLADDTDDAADSNGNIPNFFIYNKISYTDTSERALYNIPVILSEEEVYFLKTYVRDINSSINEGVVQFNYLKDFIMTNDLGELQENIQSKIINQIEAFEPPQEDNINMEEEGYHTFDTSETGLIFKNDDEATISIILPVMISHWVTYAN